MARMGCYERRGVTIRFGSQPGGFFALEDHFDLMKTDVLRPIYQTKVLPNTLVSGH
jgi:hypothetical protein